MGAIGNEDFTAVEDVPGALLNGSRGEAECVRAAIWFAHRVATHERITDTGQVFV